MTDEISPREFLRNTEFSSERANLLYPNARRLTLGGLFISHSGADNDRIQKDIIDPVVHERLPGDGYFLHSARSGGADSYRGLVQAALHWCDKFMLVISKRSLENEWVHAEVEWALVHSRPIVAVRIDETDWAEFQQKLDVQLNAVTQPRLSVIDFSADLESAQNHLALILDDLLQNLPRG
jgi:TIR domain